MTKNVVWGIVVAVLLFIALLFQQLDNYANSNRAMAQEIDKKLGLAIRYGQLKKVYENPEAVSTLKTELETIATPHSAKNSRKKMVLTYKQLDAKKVQLISDVVLNAQAKVSKMEIYKEGNHFTLIVGVNR